MLYGTQRPPGTTVGGRVYAPPDVCVSDPMERWMSSPPHPPYFNIEGLTHLLMYGAAEGFMHHLALPMGKSCFDKKANFQY